MTFWLEIRLSLVLSVLTFSFFCKTFQRAFMSLVCTRSAVGVAYPCVFHVDQKNGKGFVLMVPLCHPSCHTCPSALFMASPLAFGNDARCSLPRTPWLHSRCFPYSCLLLCSRFCLMSELGTCFRQWSLRLRRLFVSKPESHVNYDFV